MRGKPDCPICHGTGYIVSIENGVEAFKKCECTIEIEKEEKLLRAMIPQMYKNCSFSNYKPQTNSQKRALKISKDFVERYPLVRKGLLFQGPSGVGKTHLAVSIIKELILKKNEDVLFYDVTKLINDLQMSIGPDKEGMKSILSRVENVKVLVLDDLGAHRMTEWIGDMISIIINRRYSERRITIFTTNYLDEEYRDENDESLEDRIGERLRSRLFEMAETVYVGGKDFRKITSSGI